jgi:hypothetical protein
MKSLVLILLLFLAADGPARPEAAIPYFTNIREVQIAEAGRQNYFIVDEELWTHSRTDLGDLRLYDGETPMQFALSEQHAGISSQEVEAKILNLGSVSGHTEFDLDSQGIPDYDRIRLRLDAHDFVATAAVSGGSAPGKASEVELPPSTLYDFTKEQLGSNGQLKLPASSFRYLHVRLSPGILPEQVTGASIYNVHEQHASWTEFGSCAMPEQKQHVTVISCKVPEKIPLDRILLQIAPTQVNFRRMVSVEDSKGVQLSTGEISRVRVNRAGTLVTAEDLSVNASGASSGSVTVLVDNGDNPPLAIVAAAAQALERRVYFDPQGRSTLKLYYGDEKISPPVYDYARFFHEEPSAAPAQLTPGLHNARYTARPDSRPWSEQHTVVLWGAMLLAVLALAVLALRGLRAGGAKA